MPFLDTLKGNWLLPTPQDPHGAPAGSWLEGLKPAMHPAEIALLLLWMVKKEVISPFALPFLLPLLPIFNDGEGHLSFMRNMRGAL